MFSFLYFAVFPTMNLYLGGQGAVLGFELSYFDMYVLWSEKTIEK
jgi:hypothetical protein